MDAVGSERAALLACGESGQTAVLFAATNPERVQFLVLFRSYARLLIGADYPWGFTAEEAERLVTRVVGTWGLDEGEAFAMPDADRVFTRWNAKNQRISCSPREVGVWLRQAVHSDVRHALAAVQAPTLVLHRRDPAVVPGAQPLSRRPHPRSPPRHRPRR
jgi:pimeloyl-ACP methyl ester carboxylesterase